MTIYKVNAHLTFTQQFDNMSLRMFPINFQRQKHKFHYVGEGNVIQHIVQNSVNFEENPYNYILSSVKLRYG